MDKNLNALSTQPSLILFGYEPESRSPIALYRSSSSLAQRLTRFIPQWPQYEQPSMPLPTQPLPRPILSQFLTIRISPSPIRLKSAMGQWRAGRATMLPGSFESFESLRRKGYSLYWKILLITCQQSRKQQETERMIGHLRLFPSTSVTLKFSISTLQVV